MHTSLRGRRTACALSGSLGSGWQLPRAHIALASLGDTALVLRSGMGEKARAAVSETLTRHPEATGVVLVATGSYLGEGFD